MCYLVLDEADRMVNTDGFHDDIVNLLSHPSCPPKDSRNTVMFRCDSHKIMNYVINGSVGVFFFKNNL